MVFDGGWAQNRAQRICPVVMPFFREECRFSHAGAFLAHDLVLRVKVPF
jgi:hypothetical protein